jgi:hypothetical protein
MCVGLCVALFVAYAGLFSIIVVLMYVYTQHACLAHSLALYPLVYCTCRPKTAKGTTTSHQNIIKWQKNLNCTF